jgi:hypothetical protein
MPVTPKLQVDERIVQFSRFKVGTGNRKTIEPLNVEL